MPQARVSFKDINAAWFVGEVPGFRKSFEFAQDPSERIPGNVEGQTCQSVTGEGIL